jgi:KDO2-lipid IV(A) lauroyltransferase
MGLGRLLPRHVALSLFGAGGAVVHSLEREGRRRTIRNLRWVYGENGAGTRRMARRVYRELGRNAADVAWLERSDGEDLGRLVEVRGFDRLEAALQSGRGVVGITAHLGNWELLAAYLGSRGVSLTALATTLFHPGLDERLRRLRARYGVRSLYRSEPGCLRDSYRLLARGEMLGVLMDLRCRDGAFWTDFLGKPAPTVLGPVRLAGRTGSILLPMACWRAEGDRYRIEIDRPLSPDSSCREEEAARKCARECVAALERFIQAAPDQWVWMHDRWGLGAA